MTEDITRIWRLPLPSVWEPDGFWCVSFVIPEGDDYVTALSAAIGVLTIAKTFERDETHFGAKIVSETWERALYLNPMSVNENCAPVAIPPIPNEDAAEDAAAALFTQFYRHILTSLNACAPTVGDCEGCVDDLYAEFAPYGASSAVRGALLRLCSDLNELTEEQREAYEEDCPWVEQFDALSDQIEDNPFDWLNKLSDWIFDWLNETADAIFNDLNTVGGLMTGSGIAGWIANNGGIPAGGGAAFGTSCEWMHVIDFTAVDDGWVHFAGFTNNGLWSSGTGWQAQYTEEYGAEDITVVDITRAFPTPFALLHMTMTFDIAHGDWESGGGPAAYAYLASTVGTPIDTYGVNDGSGIELGGAVGGGSVTAMRIQLIAGSHARPHHGVTGGSATLTALEITGTGPNPWA